MDIILLAGGVGKRMKQRIAKQFLLLGGKPIIIHTLERLEKLEKIEQIIITSPVELQEELHQLIKRYQLKKRYVIVTGGSSRQASVKAGLDYVHSFEVMIHEAVRPFVLASEFEAMIESDAKAVTYGTSIPFTVLEGRGKVEKILDRSQLFNVQLPQKYLTQALREAHEVALANKREYTEDASLYFDHFQCEVKVMQGSEYNIKVTTPIDLIMGEAIYKEYILGGEV